MRMVDIKTMVDLDKASSIEEWMYAHRLSNLEEVRETVPHRMITQGIPAKPGRFWRAPAENELVLLRRFEIDKHLGQKFQSRWEEPYRLADVAWHGRSGRLQDIGTGEVVRVRKEGLKERVHLNDLKVFIPRDEQWFGFDGDLREDGQLKFVGMCERLGEQEWVVGQREFDMSQWVVEGKGRVSGAGLASIGGL